MNSVFLNKRLSLFFYPALCLAFFFIIFSLIKGNFFEVLNYFFLLLIIANLLKLKHQSLLRIYQQQDKPEKVLFHLKVLYFFQPFSSENANLLGEIQAQLDHWPEAIVYWERARKLNPKMAKIYSNLGLAYQEVGETNLALKILLQAEEKNLANADIFSGIGLLFTETGNYQKAIAYLEKGYKLRHDLSQKEKKEQIITGVHKLSHDREQILYLLEKGMIATNFSGEVEKYRAAENWLKTDYSEEKTITLGLEEQKKLPEIYDKNLYFQAVKSSERLMNPRQNFREIEKKYQQTFSGLAFFDDFLTTEVCQTLYEFCLSSTVWHDCNKTRGYLGSYLDDGFHLPLLFQLAEELRNKLPGIFAQLPLTYLWAYKYENEGKGFKLHADRATINVNFWLTPDSANLEPEHGGMIIYEKLPPPEWNFDHAEIKTATIEKYLREEQSSFLEIPYRQNRVVIFNSRLFHETAFLRFRNGYENRRINVTMLFGNKPQTE